MDAWHYREQDGHPEIRPHRSAAMLRRVTYARLRAEGHSVIGAAAILGIEDEHTRGTYERRRQASADLYRRMCEREAAD
jgi:hypothetical protein